MALNVARGTLSLTIDEAELEAVLSFKGDAEGAEWTAGKVARHLLDARIAGVTQKRAEELVKAFARAGKTPVREVVARGVPPEAAQPETPDWAELPIPPELAKFAELAIFEAPPPDIHTIKIETERVERMVRKPAALPFLPARQEKIVEERRREVRESVAVNPNVERIGYARSGDLMARIAAAKPGKGGKTIHGKPIPLPPATDQLLYCGAGVRRERFAFVAVIDGFVRIGDRWVDIVAFPQHDWNVNRSLDGATLHLDFSPGDRRLPPPPASAIMARAQELGAGPEDLVDEAELAAALRASIASGQGMSAWILSRDRDAQILVDAPEGALKATLTLRKARGRGKSLDLAQIGSAITAARLKGLKTEELKKAIVEFYRGAASELIDYPLCEGKSPTRGEDRDLVFSLAFMPEEKAGPLLERLASHPQASGFALGQGQAPDGAGARLAFVVAGQELAALSPGAAGQAGWDARGKPLPAIAGNDPHISLGSGVRMAQGRIVAERSGLLVAETLGDGEGEAGETRFSILPWRDRRIEVAVGHDGMEVYANLVEGEGYGNLLDTEAVLEALTKAGVVQGIDHAAIAQALAEARAGEPVVKRVLAQGTRPVPAGGAKVTWLLRLASGKGVTLRGDGGADFREQDRFTPVLAAQPVLEIERSGDAGSPGLDVRGKVVPPPASADQAMPEWDDSFVEEAAGEGKTRLIARKGGELKVDGTSLSIVEVHQVKGDVGPSSGNIRFSGAVQIGGSVLSTFQVHARGDVSIKGGVEAALVSSDASIRLGEGIKGRRRGTLRAKSTLDLAFAEQATLLSVGDIRLRSACLLCAVKTNGRLMLAGEKGALIGGQIKARLGVEAHQLGSENGIKTNVSFGQDYLVADQIELEDAEVEKLKLAILELDRRLKDLEGAGAALEETRKRKLQLMRLLEKRGLRAFDLRERFEAHSPGEVKVRGTVYPGVVLESHGRVFEVMGKRTKVAFAFDERLGRIVERPLG